MIRLPWWLLLLAFVLGWLASWKFNQPAEDWRTWKRQVEQHEAARAGYMAAIEQLQRERDHAIARSDSAQRTAARMQLAADSLRREVRKSPPLFAFEAR